MAVKRCAQAALLAILAVSVALVSACASNQAGTPSSAGARLIVPTPSVTSAAPRPAAAPKPAPPNRCAGNTIDQLVKVSISAQHLWLCADSTMVLSTPITSGAVSLAYDSTPTGNFHIQGRDRNTVLTLNTGKQYDVKYWIPFSGPLFGFHDSSWQTFPYGSAKYKTEGSHGCIHMPLQAIAYLYGWAHVGASVHIRA
jgi:hypothetical protein